ncbi:hypothetical protein MED297_04714 [Reinekea sp. MED297]|uniref:Uncharacterized protein n=2 Tax=Reinekea TaxID=230494 RepID=A4BK08_9GAMM|nr:hypothetical protein MED297_04714 [Reinekea sp. MED297] [Reinekea blandensis MED297]
MMCLCLTSALFAADYQSASFQQAYEDFMLVSSDEGGSSKKLVSDWQTIVDDDKRDPFTLVMLGSSQTLRGRDAWMPWSKMEHTETGLDTMAAAVRLLTPEHRTMSFQGMPVVFHVKTMAAVTFIQVPEFFGRYEDSFYLFQDVLSDEQFLALPAPAKSFAYYYGIRAARAVEQETQADEWLETLAALPGDDRYIQSAREAESAQ